MSQMKIKNALISVYNKDGLSAIISKLDAFGVNIYSTGGSANFISNMGVKVTEVEQITNYPSILGGRVKTLHPVIFGGILARRAEASDMETVSEYNIPLFDLVVVDLYPFEETVAATADEQQIIEKIDIGGVALIRAAAKNFTYTGVVSSKDDYDWFLEQLIAGEGSMSVEQRKTMAAKAFAVCAHYDVCIANYFNPKPEVYLQNSTKLGQTLRYGENPHQYASFYGNLSAHFEQLHGKEISFNNLADVDAALALAYEMKTEHHFFAIIKHSNVCGAAAGINCLDAWQKALAGDPESAFGGILICNTEIDEHTATEIDALFFEVLLAPSFTPEALRILKQKKNRILLKINKYPRQDLLVSTAIDGFLVQETDGINAGKLENKGGRNANEEELSDLLFANVLCKHLKSNAICIVKNKQLLGKGAGQTSRIDALKQAIAKAQGFGFSLTGAVLASDAFFPFDDCIQMTHEAGIMAIIQPGGSIRDSDTISYAVEKNMVLVFTGSRHFKH
jgi:phosphoribosylaminoimidazolecarboxamide formyltransferase/IMP cyclohydrolase